MTQLEELASRLQTLASRIGDHERLAHRFVRLGVVTSRLESIARRLDRSAGLLFAARDDGLTGVSELGNVNVGRVLEVLDEARATVTPATLAEPDPTQLERFERELDGVVSHLESIARRIWRRYADAIRRDGEGELLTALGRIPALIPQVEALRALQKRIDRLLSSDLPTGAEYRQLCEEVERHAELWASLPLGDSPHVTQFLRHAASVGASLEELDLVRDWLDERALAASFVVRPGAPAR